jgi:predicted nucleic acid-binding protein
MITAIDTCVLLDFQGHDPDFGAASRDGLRSCAAAGPLFACDVVWAEIAGCFQSTAECRDALGELGIEFSGVEPESAFEAGVALRAYRRRRGTRVRVAADFLIGAHALHQADRLLTRDQGFYRTYFKKLSIVNPATA